MCRDNDPPNAHKDLRCYCSSDATRRTTTLYCTMPCVGPRGLTVVPACLTTRVITDVVRTVLARRKDGDGDGPLQEAVAQDVVRRRLGGIVRLAAAAMTGRRAGGKVRQRTCVSEPCVVTHWKYELWLRDRARKREQSEGVTPTCELMVCQGAPKHRGLSSDATPCRHDRAA